MNRLWQRWIFVPLLLQAAGAYGQKPSDYFESFLLARYGAAEASQITSLPFQIRDDKNGYCSAIQDHGGERFTFAVWNKESGKLFGFTEPNPRDPDLDAASFWTFENGKWVERKDVLPLLDLKDFWGDDAPPSEEMKRHVVFEMVLPKTGTTIKVLLRPFCVNNDCQIGDRVKHEAKYSKMELLWNPKTGRFTKGLKGPSFKDRSLLFYGGRRITQLAGDLSGFFDGAGQHRTDLSVFEHQQSRDGATGRGSHIVSQRRRMTS
jgi:hypothetical protein